MLRAHFAHQLEIRNRLLFLLSLSFLFVFLCFSLNFFSALEESAIVTNNTSCDCCAIKTGEDGPHETMEHMASIVIYFGNESRLVEQEK